MYCAQACLHPDPDKRMTCTELLQLPYLAKAEALFPERFWDARVRPAPAHHLFMHGAESLCIASLRLSQSPFQ